MPIPVIATRVGYIYDKFRQPGEEFEIESLDEFSPRWMERTQPDDHPSPKPEDFGLEG